MTPSSRPTIRDVAARAGVSTTAVSKVFNDTGRISAPTRERILEAAAALGWQPSATASALKNSRTRTVALVAFRSPDLLGTDPHFTELIGGLESELSPRGYGLLLHLVADRAAESATYERLARERRADGFVLTESRIGDPRYALTRRLAMPAVLLGTPYDEDPIPHAALPQPEAGVRAAVHHLAGLGHRRIAYVAGPDDRVHTVFRRRVFQDAVAEAGLPPAETLTADFTERGAVRATEELLRRPAPPTAIVYANDSMAVCGMGTAQRLGLSVPADVSVIGYDDLPVCRWVHPRLTTVDQHVSQAGAAAARALLALCGERIDTPPLGRPPQLVIRESTGPSPQEITAPCSAPPPA